MPNPNRSFMDFWRSSTGATRSPEICARKRAKRANRANSQAKENGKQTRKNETGSNVSVFCAEACRNCLKGSPKNCRASKRLGSRFFAPLCRRLFRKRRSKNYSRPNRRWLALERDYYRQAGVNLPFAPDTIKKRGTRLAVALDTSGSIDEGLLGRFIAEIAAMCVFNQRNLVLIIGDAAVHQITEIDWRMHRASFPQFKYTGGGGTDFRPLIAAAAEYEPDALVYLTDLYGETGDEPDFPVIWATHGAAGNAAWGEQINLNSDFRIKTSYWRCARQDETLTSIINMLVFYHAIRDIKFYISVA